METLVLAGGLGDKTITLNSGLKCMLFILNLEIKKKKSSHDHFWGIFFWVAIVVDCYHFGSGCDACSVVFYCQKSECLMLRVFQIERWKACRWV